MRLGSRNQHSEAFSKSYGEEEAKQSAPSTKSQDDKTDNKGQVLEVLEQINASRYAQNSTNINTC